ncbi:MAG TPA: pantoate--beta-alanine ligase [Albidovulum sp.]|uniref:pantoate--beta-alanine ligase n=1 Tax=Albidovulum sp. TaxID=1872424 RepID=UPI002C0D63CE|nr:pantoate--beta-alanine ligase [Albidovulum sp.]
MRTVRDVKALRGLVAGWKAAGNAVGVVPTMGALHAGHLSLVHAAKAGTERVIATIFVNPRQFNNPDDLAKYPRTEERDAAMLMEGGVDVLFAPPPEVVYPQGFATSVSVGGVSRELEGAFRPGHFDGVATVVTKLLLMTGADRAFFGEKDWQQLQVVRRLVRDLNIPMTITGCPTLREADGLAMSSRNVRLSAAERRMAPVLHRAMVDAAEAIRRGQPADQALGAARAAVLAAGFSDVEYLERRDAESLGPATGAPARILAAAVLGGVRLIDNIPA